MNACFWSIYNNFLFSFKEINVFKFSKSWDNFARKTIYSVVFFFLFLCHRLTCTTFSKFFQYVLYLYLVSFPIPYLTYFCQYFFNLVRESRLMSYPFYCQLVGWLIYREVDLQRTSIWLVYPFYSFLLISLISAFYFPASFFFVVVVP